MGVKDLWQLSSPVEERVSLHSLRGQTLAVDLAGWVVQNQTAPGLSHSVTRPHLRNLFFRTHTLLSLDILPVMILDGACPLAKSATVQARNKAAWGSSGSDSPKRQHRRRFAGVLKDCARLLASLGVPCITAPGEAEAYCAWLDRAGLVDAVVSDDSDCFCYGAKTVLRNFSTDPKNFSVSRCTAARLRTELGLSRQRLVVMALMLGSDFNPGGVAGVGREALVRLFGLWGAPSKQELDLVLGWLDDGSGEGPLASKPVHCGTCGHPGSVGSHRKSGCPVCGSVDCSPGVDCTCTYHSPGHQLLLAESAVRKRAVACPGWPFREVVEEFYMQPASLPQKFRWSRPRAGDFCRVATGKMDWLRDYCVEKVIEVVVRWQVQHPLLPVVSPMTVVKKRVRAGENMLEVQWSSTCTPTPTSCPSCSSSTSYPCVMPQSFLASVPSTDFSTAFPLVYRQFEEMLEAKEAAKRKPRGKKKGKENVGDEPGKEKKTAKKKVSKNQPKISDFVQQPKSDIAVSEGEKSLDRPKNVVFKKLVSEDKDFNNKVIASKFLTPKETSPLAAAAREEVMDKSDSFVYRPPPARREVQERLEDSCPFTDSMREYMESGDDSGLSDIIDDIVGIKKQPAEKKSAAAGRRHARVDNLVDSINMMNISDPHLRLPSGPLTPLGHLQPRSFVQTSTPAEALCFSFSPALKKPLLARKIEQPGKASDVFDISDCSFMMEVDQSQVDGVEEEDNAADDSFDQFELKTQETPFAERVRKRLNR